ncbi:MAG: DUF3239 domain-containing protein [Pirellula sp.]|jgi:hypothetical protein
MNEEQSTWTLDDSSRASNPGNLDVQYLRWFKSYPMWPLVWFSTLAIFTLLSIFLHWVFWIPAVLLLVMNLLYWRRVSDHFHHGCANPGVVLSLEPMLIAVATDLTMGDGQYPVIKIIEKKLASICGNPPKVGSIVPTVALYQPSMKPDQTHWADFDPRPVDCATSDLGEIKRVIESFTPEDLKELHSWIQQVPRPYQPGLYPIEPI